MGALLLSAAPLSQPIAAQQPAIPDSGARVRIWTPTGRVVGDLVRLSTDSIVLTPAMTTPGRSWPREAVRRLQVSGGRRGHLWIGLAAGTALGFAAGVIAADASDDQLGAGAVGVGVWLGGTVAGGVVGALIRTERWTPAAWPAARDGAGVASRSPAPPK
jgi:hypothetical protein